MKTLIFFAAYFLSVSYSFAQYYEPQVRYQNSRPRPYVPQYNPYAAQAEYYRVFNREMTPVYNGATQFQRVGTGLVRAGSYLIPRGGRTIRQGYNSVQQYINSRPINLPTRYRPNY